MELTGKCVAVLDIQSGTSKAGNPWQKQDFVIEVGDRYPKKVCFQLFGDRVNDCPNVGDEVTVSFDAESREWNGRWFTQLNAWKVENKSVAQPQPQPQAQTAAASAPASAAVAQEGKDDFPF